MYNTTNEHFLQSQAWAEFQTTQGRQVVSESGDGWSYRAIVETASGFTRLYCPYGPTLERPEALAPALRSLEQAAKTHGAHYLRLQPPAAVIPSDVAARHGLRRVDSTQPAHTWCIDVTPDFDQLLAAMKQNTRNIVRNYHKKDLTYRQSSNPADITPLLELLAGVASHNQITVHSPEYFAAQAETLLPRGAGKLHFIDYQGQVIAAALTYQTKDTWYYAHAAADHDHRKLGASTALLGEVIHQAKLSGARTMDLYGITTSDDPQHRWAGFTRFKKSFGGYTVDLGNTYELPVRRLPYTVYTFLRRLRKIGK